MAEEPKGTSSGDYQFIQEKIVKKRKNRWLRRLGTGMFVVLMAVVFGLVERYVFLVSDGVMREWLGIKEEPERQQVNLSRTTPALTPTMHVTLSPTPHTAPTKALPTPSPVVTVPTGITAGITQGAAANVASGAASSGPTDVPGETVLSSMPSVGPPQMEQGLSGTSSAPAGEEGQQPGSGTGTGQSSGQPDTGTGNGMGQTSGQSGMGTGGETGQMSGQSGTGVGTGQPGTGSDVGTGQMPGQSGTGTGTGETSGQPGAGSGTGTGQMSGQPGTGSDTGTGQESGQSGAGSGNGMGQTSGQPGTGTGQPAGQPGTGAGTGQSASVGQPLSAEFYTAFYQQVRETAEKAAASLVYIEAIEQGMDWFQETYEIRTQTTGLVLGNDGVDLLILSESGTLFSATRIEVLVDEDDMLEGRLFALDPDYGLAVIAVPLAVIPAEVLEKIELAVISEEEITAGTPIVALGAPNGYEGSMELGMITSRGGVVPVTDGQVPYFTTNLVDYAKGHGFILNLSGEVLGMITHTQKSEAAEGISTAITLNLLKSNMEKLLNQEDSVYVGIKGQDLLKSLQHASGIPSGVYVREVEPASPALTAGIKAGDILIKIGGQELSGMDDFTKVLLQSEARQILQVTLLRMQGDGMMKEVTVEAVLVKKTAR